MSEEAQMSNPVLIAAFEGWNDACQAATNVIRYLVGRYESREIRHISCDGYYDYQVARPMMCHAAGYANLIWPQTTFYDIALSPQYHLYAQIAPEPNYRWRQYCNESLAIAEELDVNQIITMGSMFSDCPHTRPLPLSISDSKCQCEGDREYNGPVGIPTVLDVAAADQGFAHASMWVSIPQYLGSDECAAGTIRLLHALGKRIGYTFDTGDLQSKAEQWKAQASVLVRCNDQLGDYVSHLEHEYDLKKKADEEASLGAPQAEQLVKEAEDYLRQMGE
ncbi:PAC2 family protein [Bifidobacterium felsineum]|uniref:PAC2 family protein n=1 Tax=Bifidobacterium felsineum TaxID=2045440 RepID=UPI001BDC4C3C|nr:PAC2 family protein [Bifidobacterium felsineum]MBT1164804.1 PAC2 family protein [Bifidobacterium felsineum]